MEILCFDIMGKFAHFRKFHGNNTALSYSIPPRTTLIGMLASIMGLKKDEYYQDFSHSNLRIGIKVLSPIKKSFHRLNLLKVSGKKGFRGESGPAQTPFEVITGFDLKKDLVKYRVFLAKGNNDYPFQAIKEFLENESQSEAFNLSFGIAGFNAWIENIEILEGKERTANQKRLQLHSAGNSDQIEELFFENEDFSFNHIEEELLPADFEGGEKGRDLAEMNRVLFSTKPFPMEVELTGKYFEINRNNELENIQFLEYVSVLAQQGK